MLHSKHEMLFSLFPSEENNTPIKSVDANGYRIVFYNFLPAYDFQSVHEKLIRHCHLFRTKFHKLYKQSLHSQAAHQIQV